MIKSINILPQYSKRVDNNVISLNNVKGTVFVKFLYCNILQIFISYWFYSKRIFNAFHMYSNIILCINSYKLLKFTLSPLYTPHLSSPHTVITITHHWWNCSCIKPPIQLSLHFLEIYISLSHQSNNYHG